MDLLIIFAGAVITSFVGYLFMGLRDLKKKLEDSVSEDKVKLIIQDQLQVMDVHIKTLKEDTDRIEQKLDLIIMKWI